MLCHRGVILLTDGVGRIHVHGQIKHQTLPRVQSAGQSVLWVRESMEKLDPTKPSGR